MSRGTLYGAPMDFPGTHLDEAESAIAEAKKGLGAVRDEAAVGAIASLAVAEALLAVRDVLADIRDHLADPPA